MSSLAGSRRGRSTSATSSSSPGPSTWAPGGPSLGPPAPADLRPRDRALRQEATYSASVLARAPGDSLPGAPVPGGDGGAPGASWERLHCNRSSVQKTDPDPPPTHRLHTALPGPYNLAAEGPDLSAKPPYVGRRCLPLVFAAPVPIRCDTPQRRPGWGVIDWTTAGAGGAGGRGAGDGGAAGAGGAGGA